MNHKNKILFIISINIILLCIIPVKTANAYENDLPDNTTSSASPLPTEAVNEPTQKPYPEDATQAPSETPIPLATAAPSEIPVVTMPPLVTTQPVITMPPQTDVLPAASPILSEAKVKNPVNVQAAIVSRTSIRLTWDRRKKADGYIIYRQDGDDDRFYKIKKITRSAITEFIDTELTYKEVYTYKVCSYKKYEEGIYINKNDPDTEELEVVLKFKAKYKNGYKLYYDDDDNLITDVEGIIGKQSSYVVKVNTEQCVTTIYAKDGSKGYIIPVKSFICSPGKSTKSGSFRSTSRYRYKVLFFHSYSQWTVRIHGSILFHTSTYLKYKNKTSYDPAEYNKLGTPASHGCIRLQCVGAKWIYDNCKYGTRVIIYKSSNPGPFGKPEYEKLPKWHTWDPTDPTCADLCKEKNCH